MTSTITLDDVRLMWHDETCPEAGDCRDRQLHALSNEATVMVVERVVSRALAHERARVAAEPAAVG